MFQDSPSDKFFGNVKDSTRADVHGWAMEYFKHYMGNDIEEKLKSHANVFVSGRFQSSTNGIL